MTKEKYAQIRKDPKWQKKRLQIMERDEFKCVECEDSESTLNVHHAYYVSGRKPWKYPGWSLKTLCENCHKAAHDQEEDFPDKVCEEPWESYIEWIFGDEVKDGAEWHMMASFAQCLNMLRKKFPDPEEKMDGILGDLLERLSGISSEIENDQI